MADQRQPFRFRLPWLPPTATPAPPPAPAPRPRQPAAAPPRPTFQPPGVGPTPPPPRVGPLPPPPTPTPPKTTEQGSTPKPTSPPKTEPSSKPLEPAPPKAIEQGSTSKPSSPPKTEPPYNPITPTRPQTAPQQPTPPKTEPPSKTIAPAGPQVTLTQPPPKTDKPPPTLVSTSPKQPTMPSSPNAPSPSPSKSPTRLKHSSPSSSSPPTPRDKAPKKPHNSPKRESPSPTPKHPSSPTLSNESSTSKKQPQTGSSQTASNSDEVVASNPIQTSPIDQNGRPMKKEVSEVAESETVLEPAIHRKEMISTSRVGKRASQTSYTTHNSYTKPGKSNHNHKPAPLQKEIKEDMSKFVHKLGGGHGKQTLDGDKSMTVITLAGENRGAVMTLSNESSKKESPIHIHRGYKLNPNECIENSTEGKESSNSDEETATKACINNNVQGINNSLLFNGSVSTMNPGVRYVRDHRTPTFDQEASYEMRKAEVSGIQSEMLAYAPNVRRRCLRGLLMESSDSDTEKPRRHGCYYDRKDKDGNVDIL